MTSSNIINTPYPMINNLLTFLVKKPEFGMFNGVLSFILASIGTKNVQAMTTLAEVNNVELTLSFLDMAKNVTVFATMLVVVFTAALKGYELYQKIFKK